MLSKIRGFHQVAKSCMRYQMVAQPQRFYLNQLGLDSKSLATRAENGKAAGEVALWKEEVESKHALVLSTADEIDNYFLLRSLTCP